MPPSQDHIALKIRAGFNKFRRRRKEPAATLLDKVAEQSREWADRHTKTKINPRPAAVVEASDDQPDIVETTSEFASLVADVLRTGEEAPELDHAAAEFLPPIEVVDEERFSEPVDDPPEVAEEALVPAPTASPNLVTASSAKSEGLSNPDEIVDRLFDRMQGLFEDKVEHQPQPQPQIVQIPQMSEESQRLMVVESRNEMSRVVRSEIPKLVTTEIRSAIKQEMVTLFKAEVAASIKKEFSVVHDLMSKMVDKLAALEPRLAKLEGAVGREIQVKFPKGGINVSAPITIPEREVKVAAPINVQPPNVVFNEEAISVNFHKGAGQAQKKSKKVKFNRDAYDNIIDAEIVSD